MTVIQPNSISGITSITAQGDTINIYKSDGVLAGLQLNGVNVSNNSGVSTFANIVATNINSTGVATFAQSNPTNLNVSGVATFTASRPVNLSVSGVTTTSSIIVGTAVTINSTGINAPGIGITIANVNGGPISGTRNRIINGDMRIDQRNAGASVTASVTSARTYTLDRWGYYTTAASKFTIQQNAGSVTPPAGFTSYLGVTSSSAYSVAASDLIVLQHILEGYNTSDFAFGTASAKTVTLSFWVRSSLTGTFGGSLVNNAINRSYPFSYTISSANTWEQKSITITGDATGTWQTDNNIGIHVNFQLGTGSTYTGTAGTWAGAAYWGTTGATNIVATNGAHVLHHRRATRAAPSPPRLSGAVMGRS